MTKYTPEQFIAAIPGSRGSVRAIARRAGCAWATVRRYIIESPSVRAAHTAEVEALCRQMQAGAVDVVRDGDWIGIGLAAKE